MCVFIVSTAFKYLLSHEEYREVLSQMYSTHVVM
jgi:hypothetical protein